MNKPTPTYSSSAGSVRMRGAACAVLAAIALLPVLTSNAAAMELAPRSIFVEAGKGEREAYALTLGAAWPWAWKKSFIGSEVTGYTEAYLSQWSARDAAANRHSYTQVGAIPMFRFRFGQGNSPWFADAGIGISYLDGQYRNGTDVFSTRWNFVDVLGVGMSFGANRNQEIGVRLQHVSNASLKKPNPGENFIQLRYSHAF